MPQVIALLAAGAGLLLARRLFRGISGHAAEDLREARRAMAERERDPKTSVPLERDPVTGIYRPKQRDLS